MILLSTKKNSVRMVALLLLLAILAQCSVHGESSNGIVTPSYSEENTEVEELITSPTIVESSAERQILASSLTTIKKIDKNPPTQSFLSTTQEMSTPLSPSLHPLHEPSHFASSGILANLAQWPALGKGSNETVTPSPVEENTEAEELITSPTIVESFHGGGGIKSMNFLSTSVSNQEIPDTGPVTQENASKPPAKPQILADAATTIKKIEEDASTQNSLSATEEMSTPLSASSLSRHEPSTFASSGILATSLPSATNLMYGLITNVSGRTNVVKGTSDLSTNSSSSSVLSSSPIQVKTNGSDLPVEDKDDAGNVISTASFSPSTHKRSVTFKTMEYTTNQGSHGPPQGSGAETSSTIIMTAQPHPTTTDSGAGVSRTTSGLTSMSAPSSNSNKHWYIVIAVVTLALLLLAFCLVWNIHRRRNTGSTSFQTTNKKKKKGGEDAWAGPVHMQEDNAIPVDVMVDESDHSGKHSTLTTFFNKRKSRQCSVVMEDVKVQSAKPAKEEATPLLTLGTNGQISGGASPPQGSVATPTSVQEPTPTTCNQESSVQLQANGQIATSQETLPAPSVYPDTVPPPLSPPPQVDFPEPPSPSDPEGAGSMV